MTSNIPVDAMTTPPEPYAPLNAEPPLRWLAWTGAAVALIATLVLSSQIHVSMVDHGHAWWRLFGWQLLSWGFWAAVGPWVVRSGARLLRPSDRPPLWLGRLLAMAAVLVAVHLVVASVALVVFQPYLPVAEYSPAEGLAQAFNSWSNVDPLIFAVLVAIGFGLSGFRIAGHEELRQSRLHALLAKAELDALRLRIQPHFLFNTLNGIAALVRRREHDRALEMLLGLSELLRATLEHDNEPMVPLGEELGFTHRYLRLQQIRFEDRLRISVDAPDDCLAAAVPFLLLQPLAENAIQHGIARRAGAGAIDIAARRDGRLLILTVSDDGAGLPTGFTLDGAHGVGLANTRAKLAQIYPAGRAWLEVRTRPEGGTTAVVSLPLEAPA